MSARERSRSFQSIGGSSMKKFLVVASLMAGLSMFSAAASAQVSGTVGANWAHADADAGGDTETYGVNGGITIPTNGDIAILLDAGYAHNDDADVDVLTGTAHLIKRSSTNAWGGYVGLAHADADAGGDGDAWGAGGEYAHFFANSTLALQAGYATDDDNDVDVYGLNGEFRFFANDNLRFDVGAGWANVDFGAGDGDGTQIGAGVEYRFANSPFSIGGNVSHVDTDGGGDVDVIGATLRVDFGNGSLKERDRTGNTFGPFGGLAAFIF